MREEGVSDESDMFTVVEYISIPGAQPGWDISDLVQT